MKNLKDKLKTVPEKPGVYLMKDKEGRIIYVGKAKILKSRVRQYFQSLKNHPVRIQSMITNIHSFDYIVTDTEMEALILECNLIKKYKPYYNVSLKDDKNYPYIKITMNEDYPRIFSTRIVKKDGSKYYGPYTNADAVKKTIDTIKKIFKVRSCKKKLPEKIGQERPCLNYHIKQCVAPCRGTITSKEYKEIFRNIGYFLEGKQNYIIKKFKKEMEEASDKLDFERAAELRDRIEKLQIISEKQKIISPGFKDLDVIGISFGTVSLDSCMQMFYVRNGKLIGSKFFKLKSEKDEAEEVVSSFIKQYYNEAEYIPKEILVSESINDIYLLERWLSDKRGSKVTIKEPKRGEKKELVNMAVKNAKENIDKESLKKERIHNIMNELKNILGINKDIIRIECYDISNIQGANNVGVMIVYKNGSFEKSQYRKFKVRSTDGANDYESLKEVLFRRLNRGINKDKKFSEMPDVIFVDGGAGHVSSAKEILKELDLQIPVFGLSKDDRHKTSLLVKDGVKVDIKDNKDVFRLLSSIQEETHRFAIKYHRNLRNKNSIKSSLDNIEGIGSVRRDNLYKHFKTLDNIKKADINELLKVKGMNKSAAQAVFDFFQK